MNKLSALGRLGPFGSISLAAGVTVMTGSVFFSSPESTSRPTKNESVKCETSENNKPRQSTTNSKDSKLEPSHHYHHHLSPPKILFLGSGSSTGCPKPACALAFPEEEIELSDSNELQDKDESYGHSCSCRSVSPGPERHDKNIITMGEHHDPALVELQKQLGSSCSVSKRAAWGDPRTNKNYRNNPSLLISHRNNDDVVDAINNNDNSSHQSIPPIRNVIIDVGKTFRETAIRWMPTNGIRSLDAIVLTHEHQDAIGGLDDVRGFQVWKTREDGSRFRPSTPVYLSQPCFDRVKMSFSYLVPKDSVKTDTNGGLDDVSSVETAKPKVNRVVAALSYNIIEPFKPFVAAGLRLIPLPVMHGEDLICLGFAFSVKAANTNRKNYKTDAADHRETDTTVSTTKCLNVIYLSDISRMLPETQDYILHKLPPTDVLIIDSLLESRPHFSHFSLKQAIDLARILKPKRTFFVGMACDSFRPHEEMNEELKNVDGLENVEFAHDGLALEVI